MTDKLKHMIIQYLNSEYGDLEQFEMGYYPNYIFFMKDGKVISDYNKENGITGISFKEIWSFLGNFFGLEYEEIQDLTKEWVEGHYKLKVTTTRDSGRPPLIRVEEYYNIKTNKT
jgi:hypothetical protein